MEELPVSQGSRIKRDVKVILGKGKKRMTAVLRMVETTDEQGNEVRMITHRFDLSAEEIGDLYRIRWQIETFFRWVKQHLKMTRFYGTSQNAVMNQIWTCLIAYCLLLMTKLEMNTKKTLSEIMDFMKTLKWKSWAFFLTAVERPPSRTSRGRQKKPS
jgi:IS4 transposase